MSAQQLHSPLVWYGGKARLARRIAALFPPHQVYVEPFAGAASVLFAKARATTEIINDRDNDLAHLWRTVQDPAKCKRLADVLRRYSNTKASYSRCRAAYPSSQRLERLKQFFILTQTSYNAVFGASWSRPTRRNGSRTFINRVRRLPEATGRLRGVRILNEDAVDVIEQFDGEGVLQYLDPPYVHSTRVKPFCYRHQMSDLDHRRLLKRVVRLRSMVVLSGYTNSLYEKHLAGWGCMNIPVLKSSGGCRRTANEVLWLNPACVEALDRQCVATNCITRPTAKAH